MIHRLSPKPVAIVAGLLFTAVAASLASAQGVGTGASKLFVSNGSDVAVFAINNQSPGGPIATIQSSEAYGLGVDHGHLFVARQSHSDVAVYDTASLRSAGRLRDPGQKPYSVAFGNDGTVYVGNVGTTRGGAGSVSVYQHGSGSPTSVLTCNRLYMVTGVAVNARGDVFVNQNRTSSGTPEADVFPAGSHRCHALPITEFYYAGGAAIDPSTQSLILADEGSRQIFIAAPPYRSVTETITLPECIGENVWHLAIDPATSLLYTSDPTNGSDVFTYPGGSRLATYSMSSAFGVAIAR